MVMNQLKRFARNIVNTLNNFLQSLYVKNSYLSGIYYVMFSKAFNYEHRAVLLGIKKYAEDQKAYNLKSSALLRKNIHGLEKGLIMIPRRDVYALNYIRQTVDIFVNRVSTLNENEELSDELQWAYDVMTEYFAICGHNIVIDEAKNIFNQVSGKYRYLNKIPYKRTLSNPLSVTYEQIEELSIRRRSVRWYVQKKVERETIDKAINVANRAPSACNRQPFRYLIVDDRSVINEVSQLPFGTKGFYENIPGLVVLVGQLDSFSEERDRHLIYIDSSLSAMSFIMALETLGVSSCIINWPDVGNIEDKMRKIINLKPYERIIMLISFGYPDPSGQIPYSQKKPLDQIRYFV